MTSEEEGNSNSSSSSPVSSLTLLAPLINQRRLVRVPLGSDVSESIAPKAGRVATVLEELADGVAMTPRPTHIVSLEKENGR
ncbi:hypothetical protein GH714_027401 [Hevea brasiliensis]|uniref:Uncharacterized protein n=1 Tax=Hevea brasiliensis TaxID=3981 RepID=A0A6A6LRP8_HEVBR|nr:hypothetical protein GH714_027401 [Hevea brasiliensis]